MAAPRFQPVFSVTPTISRDLMRIEAARQAIQTLPITPRVLASLRETARLYSTHYSTSIEGNRLTQEQVAEVIASDRHFPGRERDQGEVKGYYAALDELERIVRRGGQATEADVRKLHGLAMGGGRTRVKPTPYRDAQNVIRDGRTGRIVYMPPEARDVPRLMQQLMEWLRSDHGWPAPISAALSHYQFATIHPYYDGNGRTARLLTTLILHLGGYDLKGLYALEEYYARKLGDYYDALSVGASHNYYLGRADADITKWVAYFIAGMAESCEKVRDQAMRESARGRADQSRYLRNLDPQQRKALALFADTSVIVAKDVAALFGYKPRMAALLCQRWVAAGFLETVDPAKKSRKYRLASPSE